jgi:hypothetical protein
VPLGLDMGLRFELRALEICQDEVNCSAMDLPSYWPLDSYLIVDCFQIGLTQET